MDSHAYRHNDVRKQVMGRRAIRGCNFAGPEMQQDENIVLK
jgi:hypothetical protein